MNNQEMSSTIANATKYLSGKYQSFFECVWNENEKCMIYKFTHDKDAEQYLLERQLINTGYRYEKITLRGNLIVVREYRG